MFQFPTCPIATLALVAGCTMTPPQAPTPDRATPSAPTSVPAAHPILSGAAQVGLFRYRPDRKVSLQDAAAVARFVAALAPARPYDGDFPRTMPHAEVSFADAQGKPLATAVFLTPESDAILATASGTMWQLTTAESSALRALMAQHGL